MEKDIQEILISEEEIQKRVSEVGAQITRDFKDKDPVFIGVLKGCFIFISWRT